MSLFQTDPEDDEFLSEGSARSPLTNRLQHSQAGDVALQQLISGYLEDKDLSNCGVVSDLLNALSAQVGEKLVSEGIANFSSRRRIRALSVAAQKRLRKVCITSASSTLSSQIIKQFINCGIDVVAACSGNLDAEQANALRQLGDESRLSIVQCDWGVTGFCKVFDGCDTVIHSAWPVTKCKDGETDEASAIGHVINAMNAAITTTSVRHLILTSSTAAVRYFTPIANPAVGFTPDDWSDDDRLRENNMTAALRMLLAERAAWEVFSQQHSHQRTPKLRFSSICVARLVGPSVFPTENDRNIEFISNIIRGKSPPFIDPFHYVDVCFCCSFVWGKRILS
eukprot:TRINITY_DN2021_c1_g1_i2.p1 TRINITY_DN2021_c1_g1~~TRINITY_DN2021_c1_g1_i2.p1  ORF type:complete len:339 (+),score=54.16 TRINITY_DN2021_c1_g1_i2:45-1061(+)